MKTFSSLTSVIALWLAVSFALWAIWRVMQHRGQAREQRLLQGAVDRLSEADGVFAAIRATEPVVRGAGPGPDAIRERVRALLNGIEANGAFFDDVNSEARAIAKAFEAPEFQPLSEILQIRRDFWAASEIFLIDDVGALSSDLTDPKALDAFRNEARTLLFGPERGGEDPVKLRLAFAKTEAARFLESVVEAQKAEREKGRLPKPSEVAAAPLAIVRGVLAGVREVHYVFSDFATTVRAAARTLSLKGLRAAAEEIRRARSELPAQFASTFERAGGLAQASGHELKRHYEFLLEARELRARYAEFLAQAPQLTEKGKQFLARLELERRAEELRETSTSAISIARRKLVVVIAHAIAGLQALQARVSPPDAKQIAIATAYQPSPDLGRSEARSEPASPPPQPSPIRALLPPPEKMATPYRDIGKFTPSAPGPREALDTLRKRKPAVDGKSEGSRTSLLDRLATATELEDAPALGAVAKAAEPAEGTKPRGRLSSIFRR
jgi:hypothetical protein